MLFYGDINAAVVIKSDTFRSSELSNAPGYRRVPFGTHTNLACPLTPVARSQRSTPVQYTYVPCVLLAVLHRYFPPVHE